MGLLDMGIDPQELEQARLQSAMAMAAGLLSSNGSQGLAKGLLGAGQAYQGAQDAAMKRKMQKAQIDDAMQQIELRKQQAAAAERQNSLISNWLNASDGLPGGGAPTGAQDTPAGGQSMPGPAGMGGGMAGLDRQAIAADLAFNGGKNIAQWLNDRTKPNMEVVNGVVIDKNRTPAGMTLPVISANGQATQTIVDPSAPGGFRIISPQGAADAVGQMREAEERAKNRQTLAPLDRIDPRTNRPYAGTVDDLVQAGRGAMAAPQAQGQPQMPSVGSAQPDAAVRAMIAADAQRNGIANPVINLNTASGRTGMAMMSGAPQGQAGQPGGFAGYAGPAELAAAQKYQTELAGQQAAREGQNTDKGNQFKDFRDQIGIARDLLKLGPTESTVGQTVDSLGNVFGATVRGAAPARALSIVGSWMTQNIPKAPGSQSDFELKQYREAAGLVGDNSVPVEQRMTALNTVERLIGIWESRRSNGQGAPRTEGKVENKMGEGIAATGNEWSVQKVN